MATVNNPMQYSEAARNIMGALIGTPQSKQELALSEADLALKEAQARKYGVDADTGEYDLGNKKNLAAAIQGLYDTKTGSLNFNPQAAANIAAYSDNLEALNLDPKLADAARMGLALAAGRSVTPQSAYSLEGQQNIADRDQGYSRELKRMDLAGQLNLENLRSTNDVAAADAERQAMIAIANGQPVPTVSGLAGQLGASAPLMRPTTSAQPYAMDLSVNDMKLGDIEAAISGSPAAQQTLTPPTQTGLASQLYGPPAPTPPSSLAEAVPVTTNIQQDLIMRGNNLINAGYVDAGVKLLNAAKTSKGTSFTQNPDGSITFSSGGEDLGLAASTESDLQKKTIALQSFQGTLNEARQFANDPTNFGATGWIKGTLQDALQQKDALAAFVTQSGVPLGQQIITKEGTDLSNRFDPNIGKLDVLVNTLAYQYATAVAGNDRISDADFRQALQVIGSPSDLLSNAAKFSAKLDQLEQMTSARLGTSLNTLQNGITGLQQTPTLQGLAGQLQTPTGADPLGIR